jgi:hypothetical protein
MQQLITEIVRHSLESCPSLVLHNINKPSFSYKIYRQIAELLQLFKKLHVPTQPKSPRLAEGQPEKTTGRRKSCLPAQKVVILKIISCRAKLRKRSINSLIAPWPPSEPRSQRWWPLWTGRSVSISLPDVLGLRLLWRPVGISLSKCM